MDGLTKKKNKPFSSFIIFYEIEIVGFNAITAEGQYPRNSCWKGLSDFDKIRFYQHLYHCKRKKIEQKFEHLTSVRK